MDPATLIFVITSVLGTGLSFGIEALNKASNDKRNEIINIANKVLGAMKNKSNNYERYADTLQTILSTAGVPSSRVARIRSATEAYNKFNKLKEDYNTSSTLYNQVSNLLSNQYLTNEHVKKAKDLIKQAGKEYSSLVEEPKMDIPLGRDYGIYRKNIDRHN